MINSIIINNSYKRDIKNTKIKKDANCIQTVYKNNRREKNTPSQKTIRTYKLRDKNTSQIK